MLNSKPNIKQKHKTNKKSTCEVNRLTQARETENNYTMLAGPFTLLIILATPVTTINEFQ